MAEPSNIIKRLSEKLNANLKPIPETGCVEYMGVRGSGGYGLIYLANRCWPAHRAAWILAKGPIPDGLYVCHACDNRPCCNVDHLWLGTARDNQADMARKKRSWQGPRPQFAGTANPNARLTREQVRAIFVDERILREVAADYGVVIQTVHNIRNRLTHKAETADL